MIANIPENGQSGGIPYKGELNLEARRQTRLCPTLMRPAPRIITHGSSPTNDNRRRRGSLWDFILALIGGRRPPQSSSSTSLPSTALDDFGAFDRKARAVCECVSRAARSFKQLPETASKVHNDLHVPKSPKQFPSAEDYIYFILRLVINFVIDRDIFTPFHPNISSAKNQKYVKKYVRHMAVGVFNECPAAEGA